MTVKLPLAIIQLESPPQAVSRQVGEQKQWFIEALELADDDYIVVRPDLGDALPDVQQIACAVLSGSWAMVTDHAEWSERTAAWVRHAVAEQLPLLGVCYGHQLMAYALGGEVGDNPNGWERGVKLLQTTRAQRQDPLPGAQVLAASAQDGCQIIRYSASALSLQFHPEFTPEIMAACLHNSLAPGEVQKLLTQQPEPHWPRQLLRDFFQQAQPQQAKSA
ncbi:glutamine amidotransferase [bacteria symbiont BFo1 of Frankliniella occidentalis]|nr:glutamine amidotransferase [bacteria symbiont BFo1 of Frankliniella occidentalis]